MNPLVKNENLIIIGTGEFAKLAYAYFSQDTSFNILAFAVDSEYRSVDLYCGKPVMDIDELEVLAGKEKFRVFVAISSQKMNTQREKVFHRIKEWQIDMATYVSPHAFVWHDVKIGENVFIFEGNVIQSGCEIGSNSILWSGNHIGHGSKIEENVFVSSHCVISGFCKIGKNSFLGVNSTVIDGIEISPFSMIGASTLVNKNTAEFGVYVGIPARQLKRLSI